MKNQWIENADGDALVNADKIYTIAVEKHESPLKLPWEVIAYLDDCREYYEILGRFKDESGAKALLQMIVN